MTNAILSIILTTNMWITYETSSLEVSKINENNSAVCEYQRYCKCDISLNTNNNKINILKAYFNNNDPKRTITYIKKGE